MANRERGEASFQAGDKTYTLQFSINAFCEIEAEIDKSIVIVMNEMANPATMRIATARVVLWGGLRRHHPNVTIEEAGELIDAAGGLIPVMNTVTEAVNAAFPDAAKQVNSSRPRKGVGTGKPS